MPPRLPIPTLTTPTRSFLAIRPTVASPTVSLLQQTRGYAGPQKKPSGNDAKKKKIVKSHWNATDLGKVEQFSLVEAMRYLRAAEVGQDPQHTKYEMHVKLRTTRSGPTVKSRIRLPKPVKTDMKICVIAEGKHAEAARKAGAYLVGTDDVFEKIRNGEIDFDKVICHDKSFQTMAKAKLGRILGPKGLMPSQKFGTVVPNVSAAMKELVGKVDYRERQGVIRIAIGQLAFTEEELSKNIKAFTSQIKKEFGRLSHSTEKSINEVVLSTTHGPGFSLNGEFQPEAAVAEEGKVPTELLNQPQAGAAEVRA